MKKPVIELDSPMGWKYLGATPYVDLAEQVGR